MLKNVVQVFNPGNQQLKTAIYFFPPELRHLVDTHIHTETLGDILLSLIGSTSK